MPEYRLTYVINVEAETPLEAAITAESMMHDQCAAEHTGPHFEVEVKQDPTEWVQEYARLDSVDLEEYYLSQLDEEYHF